MAMTGMTTNSPAITHLQWGQIEVEGKRYKDAKLFPGGAREWDWRLSELLLLLLPLRPKRPENLGYQRLPNPPD
jgi:hypothetical protein